MRNLQWILLGASVAFGMAWIFVIQNWLLLTIFPGMLVGPGLNLISLLQIATSPAFTVFWGGCIIALFIWILTTLGDSPKSSAQVRRKQPLWWFAAIALVLFGWLCLSWFTILRWQVFGTSPVEGAGVNYFPVPPGGWIVLMLFVIIDVALLFWLPTMLASPRTYRFVVPGAVTILGSR